MLLAVLAAVFDLRERRIPNWLTVSGVVAGLALQAWLGGLPGLGQAGLGLGLALLIHLPLFALRALGGGDVKLMAAIGALAGPKDFVVIFVFNALLGGALALAVVIGKGRLRQTAANLGAILGSFGKLEAPPVTLESTGRLALPRGAIAAMAVALWLLL